MQSTELSIENIRKDFPILKRKVRDNKPLVYLDNASTTQKPKQVIDALTNYYNNYNANIHRSVYSIAEEATEAYEKVRDKVAKFLNISKREEIIFVRGTTEGINLVAYAWGRKHIKEGDVIVTDPSFDQHGDYGARPGGSDGRTDRNDRSAPRGRGCGRHHCANAVGLQHGDRS